MSYLSSEYVQCETIQSMLDENFVTCPTPQENLPSLQYILASQQANGITQKVSDNGKVKTVKVVYDQRLLESEVTEGSGARSCTTSNETFDNYVTYTIDPTVWLNASEKFTTADLATVCTSDVQGMLAKKIAKVIDALERKIATKTATELVALTGKWGSNVSGVNGSDQLVVSTFIGSAANKVLDYTAMSDISMATMQTGYCAPIIIAGGSALYKYGQNIEVGCCSDTGVDILAASNKFGKAFLYDKRLVTALGSENESMIFQAGSVALITYNEAAQVPNLGANYAKFIMFSPRTGLPIDIVLKDDCGTIHINAYANTKLVGLPNDMYKVGDEYRGVTYVNQLLVTNS